MLITKIPKKHPKLILRFEEETGKNAVWHGELTKQFIYWLRQKIKYKNLICKDPNCPNYGKEFSSKGSFVQHIIWHNKEYRESRSGKNNWNYGRFREESPMFGKHHTEESKKKMSESNKITWSKTEIRAKVTGENNPNWKGGLAYTTTCHNRVRKIKVKPENCEICGLPEFYENFGHLELSNIKNHQYTDNPSDYQYVHRICHIKYDNPKI